MNRSSSRKYGVDMAGIQLTQYDLQLIQSHARDILLNEQGHDVARAWVKATIGYLVKQGTVKQPVNDDPNFGEQA
ncbi:MAG: hypothetical protein ACAH17_00880 [Candidatus Paceibacterota bacterium]